MKKWLYFITLQCADLSCYKLETYWNLEKQFPCGERKSFIPVSNHTIKIYFYIFTILYYVKKYRISENTSFFSCAFYAVSKRKASSSFKPEGFSVPGGLSFVMFKHRFNTSTYHFLYGWVRLSWVTWSKTVADFGSKCRNRSEWGTLAKTGGFQLFWVVCESVENSEGSVASLLALMDASWKPAYASYKACREPCLNINTEFNGSWSVWVHLCLCHQYSLPLFKECP